MNSRSGHVLWNLPGSCSLLCGFPPAWEPPGCQLWGHGWGRGVRGVQMLATGFPRTRTESSAPQPRPGSCSPRSPGCPGGLPLVDWSQLPQTRACPVSSPSQPPPRAGNRPGESSLDCLGPPVTPAWTPPCRGGDARPLKSGLQHHFSKPHRRRWASLFLRRQAGI